ncbi:hypothetical protein A2U01_0108553, partial [Trifolium medium]|nr:hypothetical protein [Trifolium medium]
MTRGSVSDGGSVTGVCPAVVMAHGCFSGGGYGTWWWWL